MIREATPADIPALIELGTRMHRESRYATSPFDPNKCEELAHKMILIPSGCLLVAEKTHNVVGWMCGGITEQWFSHQPIAFEYGLFIAPEHRDGSAGPRLVRAFMRWAKTQGAAVINMGISTGIHEERTGQLYARLGLRRVGLLYSMEI